MECVILRERRGGIDYSRRENVSLVGLGDDLAPRRKHPGAHGPRGLAIQHQIRYEG